MLLLERFSVTSAGSVTFGEQLDRFSIPSAALRAGSVEDDDPSRLSPLRMTDEDDAAVVSELLEEFWESLDLVDEPAESSRLSLLRMTEEDDELVSVGAAMVGDASSEHAAKQTMSAAAANL